MRMKESLLLLSVSAILAGCSGCLTEATVEATQSSVTYTAPEWKDGELQPQKIESIERGKPGHYALLPLSVIVDIVLLPACAGVTIAVNTGLMPPP